MIVTAHTQADWVVFRDFAIARGHPAPEIMPLDVKVLGAMNSDKQLQAAIEFNQFCYRTCYFHTMGTLTPNIIRAGFDYAFNVMNLVQLFSPASADNLQLIKLGKWLGFEEMSRIVGGWGEHTDMVLMGMHVSQCRWLKEK